MENRNNQLIAQIIADHLQTTGSAAQTTEFAAHLATTVPTAFKQAPLLWLDGLTLGEFTTLYNKWLHKTS